MFRNLVYALTIPRPTDFQETRRRMDHYRTGYPEQASRLPEEIYRDLMASLAEYNDSGAHESFIRERISRVTAPQGKATRRWLEYMRNVHGEASGLRDDLQTAIDRWWHRF